MTKQQHPTRHTTVLLRARAFCAAFASTPPPSSTQILDEHFTATPSITEHGPSFATSRLPFLGRTFTGREECLEYFRLLGEALSFEPAEDCFPENDEGYAIDVNTVIDGQGGNAKGVVCVSGKGTFKSVKTGKGWDETFVYRLSGFDEEGKVGHWEIWADPLSAWVAVGGEEE